ncbi:MAG: carboxypeptidase-like regulatory domain-containing protein, partial [Ignavibacteria bacterium]|nr:carboxypeptidase-like regulatory domain-containing protein [Ignavibacteria bacterium]
MFTFTNCIKVLVSTISIFIFMVGAFVYAGTTGKISGKIIDKTTREALIGTNVLVVGTSIGASSDLDGNYFIINLPPGEYQLKASMVGYASFVVQKVRVSVDQ